MGELLLALLAIDVRHREGDMDFIERVSFKGLCSGEWLMGKTNSRTTKLTLATAIILIASILNTRESWCATYTIWSYDTVGAAYIQFHEPTPGQIASCAGTCENGDSILLAFSLKSDAPDLDQLIVRFNNPPTQHLLSGAGWLQGNNVSPSSVARTDGGNSNNSATSHAQFTFENPVLMSGDVINTLLMVLPTGTVVPRGSTPTTGDDTRIQLRFRNAFTGDFPGFSTLPLELYEPAPIPIPAALPLLATALAGLGLLGWRKRTTV